ncbi:MAG: hypothetical protein HY558_02525 [Euryarchaeota archaeon]|nr:hypothetical protein [Euryarchaeota archaeon]
MSAEVSIVPRLTVDIEVIQDPYDATLKAIEALRKSPSITGNLLDDEAVTVATGYRVCVERAKTSFQVAACQILLPFAVEAALCPFLSPLTEGSGGT